jgi:hypothetical protein
VVARALAIAQRPRPALRPAGSHPRRDHPVRARPGHPLPRRSDSLRSIRVTDKREPVVKSEDGDTTVLDGIEAAARFIERNTDRLVRITGRIRREELDPYPNVAVREVLNNAVAHTDYAVEGASIFVALFSDRLEISSPGTWPPGFSREDFESGVSLRRNKAISRVLMRLGVIGLRERLRPHRCGLQRRRLPRARLDRERTADQGGSSTASDQWSVLAAGFCTPRSNAPADTAPVYDGRALCRRAGRDR